MVWVYIGAAGVIISLLFSLREHRSTRKAFCGSERKSYSTLHGWVVRGAAPQHAAVSYRASLEMLDCAVLLAAAIAYAHNLLYESALLFALAIMIYIFYVTYKYGKTRMNRR